MSKIIVRRQEYANNGTHADEIESVVQENLIANTLSSATNMAASVGLLKSMVDPVLYNSTAATWTATITPKYTWFYKVGRLVIFQIHVSSAVSASAGDIGTLPSTLYPSQEQIWFPMVPANGGTNSIRLVIQDSGSMSAVPGSQTITGAFVSGVYISNT